MNEAPLVCGRCGSVLNVRYDLDSIARLNRKVFAQRVRSLWTYLEFLPVQKQEIVSLGEGQGVVEIEDNR